ncbi:olfactory receptor-like protein OLF3 [Sebastes umbrosus]|uniref:olfactory receptor-like protein OLF3 n=1 Tax=Sebastes umbrosus TaxID=72105 RepID=UPI0018A0C2CD|nr:olfactory receptor-like protein OLF3 [Sebastes umbrosus]
MNVSVSSAPPITFTVYSSLSLHSVALVVCVLVFYVSGLCVNLLLVLVICSEPGLHRPMYVLLVNLSLSGVMGSTSACPHIIKHLLSARQETSLAACLAQVFFTNVYGGCIFCILALMAYDRYVSICKPLLYHAIVTPARVRAMLLLVYFTLGSTSAVQVYLTSGLRLCRHSVDKLLCDGLAIANLSCTEMPLIGVYGLCCALGLVVLPCFLVILSYVHIFTVILKTSKESQMRALQTCTPHLVTFVNFSVASFFGVIYNRLSHEVPKAANVFTFFTFFVIPPLLHPIIYGIKMKEIRQSINKMMKITQQ